MNAIQVLSESVTTLFANLVPFLFVLGIVVFFHELGHFAVARWCGVRVDAFCIGFGRALARRVDRHGTQWKIGWIPFGGYVKFHGDEGPASMPNRDVVEADGTLRGSGVSDLLHDKPLSQRAAIVAAGPMANFVTAIVIFAAIFMFFGQRVAEPRIDSVQAASAADEAGFRAGDVITGIDGVPINSFSQLQKRVADSPGKALEITVRRDDAGITIRVTPRTHDITDRFGKVREIGLLGIAHNPAGDTHVRRYSLTAALWIGVKQSWFIISHTLQYVHRVIIGAQSADQLSGPLRIAQMSGQVAAFGIPALFSLAAVLCVNVGLINLFPIPLLDGGHLLYYAIEAIRGKPLGAKAQEVGYKAGLAVIIMLFAFSTWNDLVHFNLF